VTGTRTESPDTRVPAEEHRQRQRSEQVGMHTEKSMVNNPNQEN